MGGDRIEGGLDAAGSVFGDRHESGAVRHLGHHRRVERFDDGAVRGSSDDDVAGQQSGDAGVDMERLVGELGVAGPDDDLRVGVDVELVLDGLADVDFGERAEALLASAVLTAATASS